ncbi:hypothetical protein [uncultured Ferrimonas sp.]|uniref:hypothetical protein n=1 Tax=uncultured Ferrimonas sp. TaxID=432640 RepID=UPI00263432FF|nr:hypothetical protein [uncultured Ferrimonas sp.]
MEKAEQITRLREVIKTTGMTQRKCSDYIFEELELFGLNDGDSKSFFDIFKKEIQRPSNKTERVAKWITILMESPSFIENNGMVYRVGVQHAELSQELSREINRISKNIDRELESADYES